MWGIDLAASGSQDESVAAFQSMVDGKMRFIKIENVGAPNTAMTPEDAKRHGEKLARREKAENFAFEVKENEIRAWNIRKHIRCSNCEMKNPMILLEYSYATDGSSRFMDSDRLCCDGLSRLSPRRRLTVA